MMALDSPLPAPLDSPLPALAATASCLLGAFWSSATRGTGVSAAGLQVIGLLAAQDGLNASQVAAQVPWSAGTVSAVVQTLVRHGYVDRRGDDRDRRVVRLFLTDTGQAKARESAAVVGPRWQAAFDYIDQADEPAVRRFLLATIERFGGDGFSGFTGFARAEAG
jgi:DNA-binding MarR family transcriptional regulator